MKTLTIAAMLLVLVALPAQAQMGGGGGKRNHGGDTKSDEQKPKVDDKAYKEALKRIPEPKEKYDPWGVARPADTDKKAK